MMTTSKDWMAIWNDSLKEKVFGVLAITHCGVCGYMINISEIEEEYRGFIIDFDPTCRICGNSKEFLLSSIKVKMSCGRLKKERGQLGG